MGGYDERATVKPLLETVFKGGLVPDFMAGQFAGLKSVLQEGVPTTRNRAASHGAGATPQAVPDYVASFVLHQTAAAILFFVEAHAS